MDNLINALIFVVVGLALFGVILDFTNTALTNPNITSTQASLINLVPVFYVIGLVVAVIGFLMVKKGGKAF